MLRLCCDAFDALCGCEFSTTGRIESSSRRCDAPSQQCGLIWEQHNSGAPVPKSLGHLSAQIDLEFRKQRAR
jgi:hypothetical protein